MNVVVCGGAVVDKNTAKIAYKGAFYIKKFQACKSGKNCVGVDDT